MIINSPLSISTLKVRIISVLLIATIAAFSIVTLQGSYANDNPVASGSKKLPALVNSNGSAVVNNDAKKVVPAPAPVVSAPVTTGPDESVVPTAPPAAPLTPAAAIAAAPDLTTQIIQSFLDQVAAQYNLGTIKVVSYTAPVLVVRISLKPIGPFYIVGTATINIDQTGIALTNLQLQVALAPIP